MSHNITESSAPVNGPRRRVRRCRKSLCPKVRKLRAFTARASTWPRPGLRGLRFTSFAWNSSRAVARSSVRLASSVRRGFLFADAIGRHYGWTYDREVLYLACLLHDLGLAPRFDTGGAFERDGADAAVEFL